MAILPSFLTGRSVRKSADILKASPDGELGGSTPATQDTMAAISELSQVVKNNPDMVELYLALGNLYRSQGEIERAVQIRNNLIVRPGINSKFKARALYELGRDYKRGGFFGRALSAFEEARTLWGENDGIISELARLNAEIGDFLTSAKYYASLKQPVAQAHYYVQHALTCFKKKDDGAGKKWLARALKTYPGSVEAWLSSTSHVVRTQKWKKVGYIFREGLQSVPPNLRFVLLDGLLVECIAPGTGLRQLVKTDTHATQCRLTYPFSTQENKVPFSLGDIPEAREALCVTLISIIEELEPDLVLTYYAALILLQCGEVEQAKKWLERTSVLNGNFWLGRLELLALSRKEHSLPPSLNVQLDFFIQQARKVKRFICGSCGIRRDQIFFICPRCQSWHSIEYRILLQD